MSKKIILLFLAVLLVALNVTTAFAAAETADFEGLGYSDETQISQSTAIEGFSFSTSSGNGMDYRTSGGAGGTAGIIAHYISPQRVEWIEIRRNDGAAFALHSMFLKNTLISGCATECKIEGLDASNNVVYSMENVDLNSETGVISFAGWGQVYAVRITATAGNLDIAAAIDNIVYEILSVSPVPYVEINQPVEIDEGNTISITNSILKAADNDSDDSALQYTVTTAPSHGRLESSDNPGVSISTFTQGNIDSGKIRYVHDDSDTTSDSFIFNVSDGSNELTNQTFIITVRPVYDDPIPPGASVATFDNLDGIYSDGEAIPYSMPIDGFLFKSSDNLGMVYHSSGGQDNTPGLMTDAETNEKIESLTIKRHDGSSFKLFSMFFYDSTTSGSSEYTFEGYLDGSKVYTKSNVNVKSPITVTFDWDSVDEVRVIATGSEPDILAYFDNIVYQDSNNAPTAIALSNGSLAENAASGTVIGTFSTSDPDTGDTFTYSLVSGTGDADNASFTIVNNELRSASVFDYETKSSLSIRVRTTDAVGATYEKVFTITVTDVYETLTVTTNNMLSLSEDASPTTIGSDRLETTVNAGRTTTYTLTAEPAKGTLKNDGAAMAISDIFTQADIEANKITYTPDAHANGADNFDFSVSDGTNTVTGTFNILITAINDAPVLTPAAPSLTGINATHVNNSGQTVASIAGTTISDADEEALEGIAIISANNGNGTWQYSINNGTTWLPVGTVSSSASLLLHDTDLVRFVPDGENETTASITYRAWDRTSGIHGDTADTTANGAATAYSTATDTAGIAVSAAPAVVSSVSVPSDSTYGAGQNLDFTINFNKVVTVTGTPQIALTIGADTVYAGYYAASSTSTSLVFRYTVAADQADSDGITLGLLTLNGGTIRGTAGNDADLTLHGVDSTTGVLVDGIAPAVNAVGPSDVNVPITTDRLSVTFDEAMDTSAGTAALSSGADLSSLQWSNANRTVTYTLSGLAYGTSYTLTLTGFKDVAGNEMAVNTSHGFNTAAAPAYTITASAGSGGGVSPDGAVSVTEGGSRTFSITPDANYSIASVFVDGVNQGAISTYTFTNVTANHTITANFTWTGGDTVTYPLTITAGTGGSITSGPGGDYKAGALINISASPASGYLFDKWTTSNGGSFGDTNSANTTFTMPAGATTITAAFIANIYVEDHYIVDEGNNVTVDLTQGSSILSADQMDRLISLNQDHPVVMSGDGYTITFPQGSLELAGGRRDYDLGIGFNSGSYYAVIRSLSGSDFVLMLDFNHSGALPGEAQIRVYVGTQYAGDTLYYYYYNPQAGDLEYKQAATVDSDGYVTVRQSSCSSYVFTLYDENELDDINTQTGDNSSNLLWRLLLGASAVGIVIVMRRRKKTYQYK